jgi:kynureninase
MSTDLDRAAAERLDEADPLAGFRDRFVFADPDLIYLDGNSLGRLPRATAERLQRVVLEEWGGQLIRGWDRWIDLGLRIGDSIATGIVGARPGEVAVADSTTVNFYRLAVAALGARPGRTVIVTDRANFPTDRYVLEGLAGQRGLSIRWIDPDPVEGPQAGDVGAALDESVALVTLSHVNYRSAAVADMAAINGLARDAGAMTLWDLSHSAGAVAIDLEASGADLAVGCTYKYLNAGPGAPAYLYVRSEHQDRLRTPIQGWFGQRDQFAMGPAFEPAAGIRGWLAGTPPVLSMSAVDEGVRLVSEAGIPAIRAKAAALTEYAVTLLDAWLAPLGFELGSPRDAARRGSHVSIRRHDAERLCVALIERGVIPDYRAPDSIRIGLSPLTTRFVDVRRGLEILRGLGG